MKRSLVATSLLALAVGLVGCGSSEPAAEEKPDSKVTGMDIKNAAAGGAAGGAAGAPGASAPAAPKPTVQ